MTRYQQRRYAAQLRNSPHRAAMEAETGASTFAHYLRTDKSGARPVPHELLQIWLARDWLEAVDAPSWTPPDPVPCTVLDPFAGTGTTLLVANALGRRGIGVDLSADYLDLARERTGLAAWRAWAEGVPAGNVDCSDLPLFAHAGTLN